MLAILCLSIPCIASITFLYIFSSPVLWILVTFIVFLFLWSVLTKNFWAQNTLLFLFTCVLCLLLVEVFFELQKNSSQKLYDGKPKSTIYESDDLLGFAYKKNFSVRTERRINGETVYNVQHTTNEYGHRITPVHNEAKYGVFFFGCSVTDGTGVEDTENYPYKVAELLGNEYQVYNLGVGGSGTHHFLALLESQRLQPLVAKYEKVYFFFLSIEDHGRRVAGLVEWAMHDPRYVLQGDSVVQDGHYTLAHPILTKAWQAVKKSNIFTIFMLKTLEWKKDDINRLNDALLQKATQVSESTYHTQLTVMLSPEKSSLAQAYSQLGIHTFDLQPILPEWPLGETSIKYDGHPTASAHARMAEGIAKYILDNGNVEPKL